MPNDLTFTPDELSVIMRCFVFYMATYTIATCGSGNPHDCPDDCDAKRVLDDAISEMHLFVPAVMTIGGRINDNHYDRPAYDPARN